jgi:flagellar biosynthesis protein
MKRKRPTGRQAVALRYDERRAPTVVAKGGGELGERILQLAREHDVPLYEDRALAAALSQIPLGDEIPEGLYVAVAQVLAFAYYLSGRVPGGAAVDRPGE